MNHEETDYQPRRRSREGRTTAIGGLIAVSMGMLLFRSGPDYLPAWIAWLVAPLLWYTGFALLIGWAVSRMLAKAHKIQQNQRERHEVAAEPGRPTRAHIIAASEFAEHDFTFEQI